MPALLGRLLRRGPTLCGALPARNSAAANLKFEREGFTTLRGASVEFHASFKVAAYAFNAVVNQCRSAFVSGRSRRNQTGATRGPSL